MTSRTPPPLGRARAAGPRADRRRDDSPRRHALPDGVREARPRGARRPAGYRTAGRSAARVAIPGLTHSGGHTPGAGGHVGTPTLTSPSAVDHIRSAAARRRTTANRPTTTGHTHRTTDKTARHATTHHRPTATGHTHTTTNEATRRAAHAHHSPGTATRHPGLHVRPPLPHVRHHSAHRPRRTTTGRAARFPRHPNACPAKEVRP